MPNHVTHICTITGSAPDVAGFVERHIVGDSFDFGTIIPKPAIVEATQAGSQAEVGHFALTGYLKPRDGLIARMFPSSDGIDRFQYLPVEVRRGGRPALVKHLEERDPEALRLGKIAQQCLAETGYADWYEWSCANWGTKWGAYDYEERERGDGRFVFKFETAWSFPETIFAKLAEMWPGLVFDLVSFDEGSNFGCEGQFNGRNDFRCAKELATDAIYERVYGRPPPKYDDEGNEIEPTPAESEGEKNG